MNSNLGLDRLAALQNLHFVTTTIASRPENHLQANLTGGAKQELISEIIGMETEISKSWNIVTQVDREKRFFPFATIDQLKQMIVDLDANLKFYNRNGTPDNVWWKAQHPDEIITAIDGRPFVERHFFPQETQWDLDMARIQLMVRTLPKSLTINAAIRKILDNTTERALQQKEDRFLELKHAIWRHK
jgi:hypothetical protein